MKIFLTIRNDLLNLFFPNLCRLCGRPLVEGEEQLCLHCAYDLPFTPWLLKEENPILQLFITKEKVRFASAWLFYEKGGGVQRLVHSFKYYGNRKLAFLMGRQMGAAFLQANHPICHADLIIPVPLFRRKQWLRGYNQSEWIARGVSSALSIPVHTKSVKRVRKTDTQTRKSVYERWLNVKGIFKVVDIPALTGKHVLLLDDVITTGSTLGACVDALSTVDSIEISILVLTTV